MDTNALLAMPLTIAVPQFAKTAGIKLTENIDGWDKEIIARVHEDISYVTNRPYEVHFKSIDRKFGYAVGAVKFNDLKNVYIPIVIKKYELFPLDLIVVNEQPYPLNEQTFNEIIAGKTTLGKLTDPSSTQTLVERQNAQANDLVDYPTAKYGFLQKGCGDSSELKKIAKANPEYLMSYRNNKTFGLLKEAMLLPVKPTITLEREKVAAKDITRAGSGPYRSIDKAGVYKVATLDNSFHEGVIIANVYDLDLEKQAFSLFITDDGKYGFQDRYAGTECKTRQLDKLASVTDVNYGVGDDICFISKTAKACFATLPIKVASKSTVDGYTKISGITANSEKVDMFLIPNIKTITKSGSVYMIPSHKMDAVKLGSYKRFHWNTDTIRNQAICKYASNTTKVTADGVMLSIQNDYIKTAGPLMPSEAYELLKDYYSNAIEIIKTATAKKQVVFTGVKYAMTKEAKPFNVDVEKEELYKIASNITDPDCVDAVLSLGFINEFNVQQYIEMVPEFEEVITKLAKLLLATRLGLNGDEYAIKRAMEALESTTNILKGLKG